jgi:microcystin-dependent protein
MPRSHVPIGSVVSYAGPIPESSQDSERRQAVLAQQGFLWCNGQAVPIARFPMLHGVIGAIYGDDGAGTFCVPDLRGQFVRGATTDAKTDPDGPRAVGSSQLDALQDHEHIYLAPKPTGLGGKDGPSVYLGTSEPVSTSKVVEGSASSAPRIKGETRPINISLHYIIRAF